MLESGCVLLFLYYSIYYKYNVLFYNNYIVDQVKSGGKQEKQPGGRDDKLEILREGNDCTCTKYSTSL